MRTYVIVARHETDTSNTNGATVDDSNRSVNCITVRVHNFRLEYTYKIAGAAITSRTEQTKTKKLSKNTKNDHQAHDTTTGGGGSRGASSNANHHSQYCFVM